MLPLAGNSATVDGPGTEPRLQLVLSSQVVAVGNHWSFWARACGALESRPIAVRSTILTRDQLRRRHVGMTNTVGTPVYILASPEVETGIVETIVLLVKCFARRNQENRCVWRESARPHLDNQIARDSAAGNSVHDRCQRGGQKKEG